MAEIRIKRGTRAQLDAAALAGTLAAGEPYLITDEDRIAVGLSPTTYQGYVKVGEGAAVDPYQANVVLLMHMDGTVGGNTVVDEMGHAITAYNSAAISNAHSLHGQSCRFFGPLVSSYLESPASADWDFGADDWTIELWFYVNDLHGGADLIRSAGVNGTGWKLQIIGSHQLSFSGGGNDNELGALINSSMALQANTGYFAAVSRVGSNLYLFQDGVLIATKSIPSNASYASSYPLQVSRGQFGGYALDGYVDEVRVTKRRGRYTDSYIVQSQPFPDALSSDASDVVLCTRAQLDAAASGDRLVAGRLYLITDEGRIAVGLTTSTYQDYAKVGEGGGGIAAGVVVVTANGSTTQPLPSGTYTKITTALSNVRVNDAGWWDTANKRFSPNVAGVYAFTGLVVHNANGIAVLYKNGAAFLSGTRGLVAIGSSGCVVTGLVPLSPGDYVELYAYAESAATTAVQAERVSFCAWRIS